MIRALHRTWQRAMRRFGLPGLVALILVLPIAVTVRWIPIAGQALQASEAKVIAKSQALAQRRGPAPAPASNADHLAEFATRFPPRSQSTTDLERVFSIAAARKVAVHKGDYAFKSDPGATLMSYSATFPVRGEYVEVKGLVADILLALPHAALDELRMARADAGTRTLDAVIRLTFVYRGP